MPTCGFVTSTDPIDTDAVSATSDSPPPFDPDPNSDTRSVARDGLASVAIILLAVALIAFVIVNLVS